LYPGWSGSGKIELPFINSLTRSSDTTIAVNGKYFPTSGYEYSGYFRNIKASSVEIVDNRNVNVIFDDGIPINTEYGMWEQERLNIYLLTEGDGDTIIENNIDIPVVYDFDTGGFDVPEVAGVFIATCWEVFSIYSNCGVA
jgi:hypothetical protein